MVRGGFASGFPIARRTVTPEARLEVCSGRTTAGTVLMAVPASARSVRRESVAAAVCEIEERRDRRREQRGECAHLRPKTRRNERAREAGAVVIVCYRRVCLR
jgi:hypothetical protein